MTLYDAVSFWCVCCMCCAGQSVLFSEDNSAILTSPRTEGRGTSSGKPGHGATPGAVRDGGASLAATPAGSTRKYHDECDDIMAQLMAEAQAESDAAPSGAKARPAAAATPPHGGTAAAVAANGGGPLSLATALLRDAMLSPEPARSPRDLGGGLLGGVEFAAPINLNARSGSGPGSTPGSARSLTAVELMMQSNSTSSGGGGGVGGGSNPSSAGSTPSGQKLEASFGFSPVGNLSSGGVFFSGFGSSTPGGGGVAGFGGGGFGLPTFGGSSPASLDPWGDLSAAVPGVPGAPNVRPSGPGIAPGDVFEVDDVDGPPSFDFDDGIPGLCAYLRACV